MHISAHHINYILYVNLSSFCSVCTRCHDAEEILKGLECETSADQAKFQSESLVLSNYSCDWSPHGLHYRTHLGVAVSSHGQPGAENTGRLWQATFQTRSTKFILPNSDQLYTVIHIAMDELWPLCYNNPYSRNTNYYGTALAYTHLKPNQSYNSLFGNVTTYW